MIQAIDFTADNVTDIARQLFGLVSRRGYRQDQRIAALQNLRQRLNGCIGCGCLSMENCSLYNAGDAAAALGSGPRFLLGDNPAG